MPIQTDLSRAPYYDDYNEKDNYHRILFKPSVAVQVRELNQLQTILQNQIERFGDNVYKRGTIIDGCNFIFFNDLPYVKINDTQLDGAPVNVSRFKGMFAKNAKNLIAKIVETSDGFEATAPNLNTLHVQYLNSGASGNSFAFSRGQTITIYDPALRLFEADVITKSAGFSNNDNLVILSAIAISNSLGGSSFVNSTGGACTFSVGEVVTHSVTGAQAEIRQVNSTANQQTTILKIRPLADNLRVGNSASWQFTLNANATITSAQTNITASLDHVIGSGAYGSIITDAQGGVRSVIIQGGGQEYYVEPYITVSYNSRNMNSNVNSLINSLNITSKNYMAKVAVNDDATAIGNGVGIAVSEGIIYQKGHFTRVTEQFVVVDKYNPRSNNVVGFDTKEEIITFRQDSNLLDNAAGTLNRNAPGADRLKLTPYLTIKTKEEADSNNQFLPIIEYNLGKPFRQRKGTQFNSIAKELAQRTYEQSGNYVLDQFLVSTESIEAINEGATKYRVNVDPGTAYIDGYRIQTFAPYSVDADKATDTLVKNTSIQLKYGNYILVNEFAGWINSTIGGNILLKGSKAEYVTKSGNSSGPSQFPEPSGTAGGTTVGKAKVRNVSWVSGSPGTPDAIYAIHLFDIRMAPGKNFATNVKSVFWNGVDNKNALGDVILNSANQAVLSDVSSSGLIFPVGASAIKNINAVSYTYRSAIRDGTLNADGTFKATIAQNPNEVFPYQSYLNESDKETLVLITTANAQASVNASGGVSVSGCTTVTGTGTKFNTDFTPGDYIKIYNATDGEIRRIVSIANATSMTINHSTANAYVSANAVLFFPQYAPIPLAGRTNRTANLESNTTLTIYVGNTLVSSANASLDFNVRHTDPVVPKRVIRKAFVRLNTSTNLANTQGPWCLGVPDIFRLRDVFLGDTVEFIGNTTNISANTIVFNNTDLENGDVVTYATAVSNSVVFVGNTTFIVQGNNTANGFLVLGNTKVSQFVANQAVVYNVGTGNTVIGGLANGSTYFVIVANTTAIQLKATTTGAAINLTSVPTSSQPGHFLNIKNVIDGLSNNQQYYVVNATANGVKLSTTEGGTPIGIYANSGTSTLQYLQYVKPRVKNSIRSAFWIDHNQRKDYYDLGYLYKQPGYVLPPYHDILVQFDAFTVSKHGLKTISSYPIRDDLSLANNNSAVHTLEIPELLHDNGEYFDLRDSLDLRPYRDNTAIITKNHKLATLNPIDFDGFVSNTTFYFEGGNKKFPTPLAPCDLTYEQYLGRVDAVVLSGNGQVKIIEGTPSLNPREPRISDSVVLLNHLIVQPYPSLPKVLGSELEIYMDKKIQNVTAVERRRENYVVSTPKLPSGSRTTQQKPYTMKDIASLERRIADLEYYVSLSFTEDRVNNLQIPSSVDSAENRFKFGFFVDNFTTGDFAEINDPHYYAQIFGFELGPRKRQFKLNYKFNLADVETAKCLSGDKILLPSRSVSIITQNKATEPTTVNVSVTETVLTTTGTEITTTTTRIVSIPAEEWEQIRAAATSNTAANTGAQSSTTTTAGNTNVEYATVTKSRVVDVADGERTIDNLTIRNLSYNNVLYNEFVASKLGGTITFSYNGYNWYYRGGYYGYYNGYYNGFFYGYTNPGIILERYQGGSWTPVQISSYALSPRINTIGYYGNPSTYYYAGWTANYTYTASNETRFRFRNLYAWWWGYNLYLSLRYPVSKQETQFYTVQEPVQITVGSTSSSANTTSVYTVDSATGTATRTELVTSVSVVSNTQSVTTSLFNPKPSALMRTDQLFNLPENMNSPYIDLLSYIQSDINS